ncbi:hypothetical protein TrRE_jg998, partial [Triparma retinervis]
MAIPKSTQQFYVLTAFASLFTIIGITITAVTITHILEESKGEDEGGEELGGGEGGKAPAGKPAGDLTSKEAGGTTASTPASTPVRSKVKKPYTSKPQPLVRSSSLSSSHERGDRGSTSTMPRRKSLIPSTFTITPSEFEDMLVKKGPGKGSSGNLHLHGDPNPLFSDASKVHEFRVALARASVGRALTWLDMTSSPSSSPTNGGNETKGQFDRVFKSLSPVRTQAGGLSWKKRPLRHFPPDFVLKPLPQDSRAYRELGFYERMSLACERYKESKGGRGKGGVDRVTDLLRRFSAFAPSYYGL